MRTFNFLIVIFHILGITACDKSTDSSQRGVEDSIDTVEQHLIDTYQENFNFFFKERLNDKPLVIYEKVEHYFILSGVLQSTDKSSYEELFKQYIWTDSTLNLNCLYELVPEANYLYLPSNIEANFLNFKNTVEYFGDSVLHDTNIFRAHIALDNLSDGINVKYTDVELMSKYFESVDYHTFKKEIIYRAPLISIAHANFVDKQPDLESLDSTAVEIDFSKTEPTVME